jgi:cell wall-associated NlpC family hydrolase
MLKSCHETPDYQDLIGLPFLRGARGPREFDCYGLVIEMYARRGVTLPDFTAPGDVENISDVITGQTKIWRTVPKRTVGALITLRVEGLQSHVGYMIEPDRFIHAFEATGVTTEKLTNGAFHLLGTYDHD